MYIPDIIVPVIWHSIEVHVFPHRAHVLLLMLYHMLHQNQTFSSKHMDLQIGNLNF